MWPEMKMEIFITPSHNFSQIFGLGTHLAKSDRAHQPRNILNLAWRRGPSPIPMFLQTLRLIIEALGLTLVTGAGLVVLVATLLWLVRKVLGIKL